MSWWPLLTGPTATTSNSISRGQTPRRTSTPLTSTSTTSGPSGRTSPSTNPCTFTCRVRRARWRWLSTSWARIPSPGTSARPRDSSPTRPTSSRPAPGHNAFFWEKRRRPVPEGRLSFFDRDCLLLRLRGHHAVEQAGQLVVGLQPHESFDHLPLAKKRQRGNRADTEAVGQVRELVHVDFREADSLFVGFRQLVNRGREHAARPAPLGPEVHEHGLGARFDGPPTAFFNV